MRIVTIQQKQMLCINSLKEVTGNAGLDYKGGGSGSARSRQSLDNDWEDWE